jgi:two-component system, response regulator
METKPILLIAEDDPDDQFMFRDMIQTVCTPTIETHFVWDGFELLDFLKTESKYRTGVIVLDLNMPGKDGRTALQEIKKDPDLANIPIVVLTTSQNESDIQYCHSYGVAKYYSKPSSITEIEKIFRDLCREYLY